MELLEKLERERRELVQKRKDQKERMKALETPEEKRARRLAKKAAKVQVILCQINIFCHQLTQNITTDFFRFTSIFVFLISEQFV